MASFLHVLKRVDFDAIVDHLALTYIIKSKAELATTRIKRLLELISFYSFHLYYMKGKYMILVTSYQGRNMTIVTHMTLFLLSFNMHNILHEKYYNLGMADKYLVQT